MNERQVSSICEAVSRLFRGRTAASLVRPEYFPSLVADVREHLSSVDPKAKPSEIELHCVTALCVLGPPQSGNPPEDMRRELVRIVTKYSKNKPGRALEFAVAYGCGKWRESQPRDKGWPGQWPLAINVMAQAMVHAVREVNIWLSGIIPFYHSPDFWSGAEGRELINMDARYLALRLVNPLRSLHLGEKEAIEIQCVEEGAHYSTPVEDDKEKLIHAGARYVFTSLTPVVLVRSANTVTREQRNLGKDMNIDILIREGEARIKLAPESRRITLKLNEHVSIQGPARLEQWSCSCGNKNCAQRHRLAGWDPSGKVTLWSFLASAVKGVRQLKAKSFTDASYYPLLALNGGASGERIRKAPVLVWECSNPACRKKYHKSGKCPVCQTLFDPEESRILKDDNQLIAVSQNGVYYPIRMQHCTARKGPKGKGTTCNNYYRFSEKSVCPLCKSSPKLRRPTYLWTSGLWPRP